MKSFSKIWVNTYIILQEGIKIEIIESRETEFYKGAWEDTSETSNICCPIFLEIFSSLGFVKIYLFWYLCFFSLLLSKCSVPQSSVLNFPLSLSLNNLICIVASLPKWLSNLYSVCFQFSTGHCQLGVMLDLNLCFFLSNLFLFLCLLFKWQWHRLNSHPGSKSWNDL